MSLSLKVPALSEKPLIVAETRTHKIADFINRLPVGNLLDTASTLFEELEILNRQKVACDDRLRALEIYRPTVISLSEQLAAHYNMAQLPLPEKAKLHASAAESLWLELSYGYKLALLDKQKKLFNLGGEKSTALMLQRAMEAMRELAMVYHKTYFSLPNSVWADLNQLYLYAAQQSLHEVSVTTDADHSSTISLTYKQALLMALADPQRLASVDIQRTADYIQRHGHHAHLLGLGLVENPAGVFMLSLNTDTPPIPYTKNKKEGDAKHDIFLITVDLARLIHKHIHALRSQSPEFKDHLPSDADEPRYADLLTYLIKQWSDSPKRVFDRTRKNDSVEIAIGIPAAHHFFHDEKSNLTGDHADADDEIVIKEYPTAMPQSITSSRWIVLNLSAGGVALRKPPNIRENLRVGGLVCMRESHAKHWSVGVVRWAANNEEQQIDIGTQLIAPTAKAIKLRKPAQEQFEKALILPGIAVLKQAISIIAPIGSYSPAGQLELDDAGKVSRIIITKLIERTNSFEHFNFSYL
ncbi:MAG TPA: hypothetical protein VK974_02845 [Methylophilaceae bacterium]|nr:hypothetical protein [Methylophilaceae bacterium]